MKIAHPVHDGGEVIIPGVISHATNLIEHPELVAERIVRLARLVGRENVLAGTDCGFGTFAGYGKIDPAVAWKKLSNLRAGADLADRRIT